MEQQQSRNHLRFSIDYILSSDIERKKVRRQIDESGNPNEAEVKHATADSMIEKDTSPEKRGSHSQTAESKRLRTIFTAKQLQQLEDKFRESQYPNPQERYDMAEELGLSEKKVKTWFQNRRMKLKRDYWNSAHKGAQQASFTSTIAVPCNLPCLVNAQPVHRSCHLETGLLYLPRPESILQQQTIDFSMTRMSSPGPLQEHHRLSHFDTEVESLRKRSSERHHVSPPTESFGHDVNDARRTSAYGTSNFISTRDQENAPNVCLASSRRMHEEHFSSGYNCLTKDKMVKTNGICKRSPIIIC
ncbi:homeobox protein vent1-like [Rhopilema esculentum]|uniref:homeobox protein vent1-like n=1 Tax=Rhopilema esculentum TaxID=499914 RepID=UPI0031D43F6D